MRVRPEVLRTIATHPVESIYRFAGQIETRGAGAQQSQAVGAYDPDDGWLEAVHRELDIAGCDQAEAFSRAWAPLAATPGGLEVTSHDGDEALARALWCVIRHTGAERAVEVGVGRGVSSAVTLAALGEPGRLWSVDLPLLNERWSGRIGTAVGEDQRSRWTYVRGPSRLRLAPVLREAGPVDVFLADSLGTLSTASFDFDAGWRGLRPGGFLLANSVERSLAFANFIERVQPSFWLTGTFERKPGCFGIARKP